MITRLEVLANYRDSLPDKVMGFFLDHRPLSNFHIELFTWQGVDWPSSENAYQAAKADRSDWARFSTMTPVEAKKEGGLVKGLDKVKWDQIKLETMESILLAKFAQCPIARQVLLSTGEAHLEECNWWKDQWWGTVGGRGQNNLGKLLMSIRMLLVP